jgi:hypothetical protein
MPMAQKQTDSDTTSGHSKAYTPPKGRPTRGRGERGANRRAFGPVAQWITFALALVLVVVIIVLITGGGDFNPFDDDQQPINPLTVDAPAAAIV